jgi:integrase
VSVPRICFKTFGRLYALSGNCHAPFFRILLVSTALRISDVVSLERARVEGDRIYVEEIDKTGSQMFTLIPPGAVEALASFKPKSEQYFFWTGRGKLDTAKGDWSEILLKLYRAAALEQRSHAFRDTLVTNVLGEGGTMESAGALLGHKNLRVTQRAYEHWSSERQERLDRSQMAAWRRLGLTQEAALTNLCSSDGLLQRVQKLIDSGDTEKLNLLLTLAS